MIPPSPATGEPPDVRWAYQALTPWGPLQIEWPVAPTAAAEAGPALILAAEALAPAEPLLVALEAWLGVALDPEPLGQIEATTTHDPLRIRARIDDPAWAPAGTTLDLAWAAVRAHPVPPALATALHWAPVPARIILDQLPAALGAREIAPGDALLLPASFSPDWQAEVRPAESDALPPVGAPIDVEARLDLEALHRGHPAPPTRPARTPGEMLSVEVFDFTGIDAAAWAPGAVAAAAPALPLARCGAAVFRPDGACWLRGELIPVGTGWALRIGTPAESAAPSAPVVEAPP